MMNWRHKEYTAGYRAHRRWHQVVWEIYRMNKRGTEGE